MSVVSKILRSWGIYCWM